MKRLFKSKPFTTAWWMDVYDFIHVELQNCYEQYDWVHDHFLFPFPDEVNEELTEVERDEDKLTEMKSFVRNRIIEKN